MTRAATFRTPSLLHRAGILWLAVAVLTFCTAGVGTSRAAATSTSDVAFTGIGDVCTGLASNHLVLPTQIDEYTAVGVVPKAVRDLYEASPYLSNPFAGGTIPVRASLTWTVMTATGRDDSGRLFTVTGRFARLDPRIYSDDFVGVGSLRVTRDDHSMLMTDSSVAYVGSREGGWNVVVTGGRCAGPKP